jgi:putative transposase
MRPVRLTYVGALHQIYHRGLEGKDIFFENQDKLFFLDLVKQKSKQLKIRILAYCLTDNDYQLVIENTSGRMSDFLKNLNSDYGMYYRRRFGGKGIVFYDRYRSVLIQDENYLKMAIADVLLTPVQEEIVERVDEYLWSSVPEYFKKKSSEIVDNQAVGLLFGSKSKFLRYHQSQWGKKIPRFRSKYGYVLGERSFVDEAAKKYKLYMQPKKSTASKDKKEKLFFEAPETVIKDFETEKGVTIDTINVHTYVGKRLRAELLANLKDRAGVTYPQIGKLPLYSDLSVSSLGKVYQEAKERIRKRSEQGVISRHKM